MKKSKTIGSKSSSFARELESSQFVFEEGTKLEQDVNFLLSQPNAGKRLLQYFLSNKLNFKEVFDATHIIDCSVKEQKTHIKNIKKILKEAGWEGKIDLHTKPMGAYDSPSPHIHIWGKKVGKDIYSIVAEYLKDNRLTNEERLKKLRRRKIEKLTKAELEQAATLLKDAEFARDAKEKIQDFFDDRDVDVKIIERPKVKVGNRELLDITVGNQLLENQKKMNTSIKNIQELLAETSTKEFSRPRKSGIMENQINLEAAEVLKRAQDSVERSKKILEAIKEFGGKEIKKDPNL